MAIRAGLGAVYDALFAAGIADNNTRRVIIDVEVGQPVKVYVEKYGDDGLVDCVLALKTGDIQYVEPPKPAE